MSINRIHIVQGEHAVGSMQNDVISTLLGSCVSCCLWDPVAGVGGMNHMLLAVSSKKDRFCNLAGINAMELLTNGILKLGGRRDRLKAKAFGGARMVAGLSNIGEQNSTFALDYLEREGIVCEGHSFGGTSARQLMFWPASGRALQKIRTGDVVIDDVPAPKGTAGNDLELF